MDDTQTSIKSSEAAAASRKRRSSILKSQRPPRTPFSELEFNVATPTDTTKSRRVSFSRKTGVAEFVTNEATTTWKNFYEEHNKSLESSGNESAANAPRPVIGHIGKRIFDQQFEEVEVVDIGGTLQTNSAVQEIQSSFNNVNLTQQLMAFELECRGDDNKLTAPAQNFELSNLTDNIHTSKVFGNDMSIPMMNEMSNPISMNFSNIEPLGKCDDLEEIAREFERPHPRVMCQGPFSKDVSEYIEVDLNVTNVMRSDDCDMSITDTIQNPKVQAAVKPTPITTKYDGVDKENIMVNPYITSKETDNFAINEEFDKVLVFDGKKLTVQSERKSVVEKKYSFASEVPPKTGAVPKRKTIVLNTNDDLPNFIPDSSSLMDNQLSHTEDLRKSLIYNDCNLSLNQTVGNKIDTTKRKTIVFDDDARNLSITQTVPAKVLTNKQQKCVTVIYDNDAAEVSITQAVAVNKIIEKEFICGHTEPFTRVLPANQILNKTSQNQTIYYQEGFDISVTKAVPDNKICSTVNPETDNDMSNISITQVVPTNIIVNKDNEPVDFEHDILQELESKYSNTKEKRRTIVYDGETGNVSLTQTIPTNLLLDDHSKMENTDSEKSSKRKTIIFDNKDGDVSMTEAIPLNIIASKIETNEHFLNITKMNDDIKTDNKRKTIIFNNKDGDVSMTEAIPVNIIASKIETNEHFLNITKMNDDIKTDNKRKTIIYDNKEGDVSMTEAIPPNIIQTVRETETKNKRQSLIYDKNESNISMTEAIPTNIIQASKTQHLKETDLPIHTNKMQLNIADRKEVNTDQSKLWELDQSWKPKEIKNEIKETKDSRRKTIVYGNEEADISITQIVPSNIIYSMPIDNAPSIPVETEIQTSNKRKTIIYDNNGCDVSMTRMLPTNIAQTKAPEDLNMDISISHTLPSNILVFEEQSEGKTLGNANQSLSNNLANKSNVLEKSNYGGNNISMTKPIPASIIDIQNQLLKSPEIDIYKSMLAAELQAQMHQGVFVYQSTENNVSNFDMTLHSKKSKPIDYKLNESSANHDDTKEEKWNTRSLCNPKLALKDNHDIVTEKNKKSIINELLDMSDASLLDIDKTVNHLKDNQSMTAVDKENRESDVANILDAMKGIEKEVSLTADIVKDVNTNVNDDNDSINDDTDILNDEITQNNIYYTDKNDELELKNKNLEQEIDEGHHKSNQHFEKVVSLDLQRSETLDLDKSNLRVNKSVVRDIKCMRDADNTRDLLDMLNDLTGEQVDGRHDGSEVVHIQNEIPSNEPRRISVMPKRQSVLLSREDLLNNISMAQAALQLSRSYNDTADIEDTQDSPEEEKKKSPRKYVRMSSEAVKTLHFDDSINDTSVTAGMNTTPLKKTTFGDITYIGEDKAKVIPSYLKDVSDGIKALMTDLVKPTIDVPIEDKHLKKSPSTCSTQIQANLTTSSQVDIRCELHSNSDLVGHVVPSESLASEVAAVANTAVAHAIKQLIKSNVSMDVEEEPVSREPNKSPPTSLQKSIPGSVIVFDHHNPLNNILLTQIDNSNVHKYNPIKESPEENKNKSAIRKSNLVQIERVSARYDIEKRVSVPQRETLAGDFTEKTSKCDSAASNTSRPLSIDKSIEGIITTDMRNTEINTLIAMKDNKELLEANSSLTLVDDVLGQPLDIDMENVDNLEESPIHVIYKIEEDVLKDSDLTSNDEYEVVNPRKRSFSPIRRDKNMAIDVTPKPFSKMQKVSFSPKTPDVTQNYNEPHKYEESERDPATNISKKRGSIKKETTVQQLITYCYRDAGVDGKIKRNSLKSSETVSEKSLDSLETLGMETISRTFQNMKSDTTFTSSKDVLPHVLPEDDNTDRKTLVSSSLSSIMIDFPQANIVAKIEMLPFMGTKDCVWETRKSDIWTFLLLRSRVRLCVRLSPPTRRRQSAPPDTPVVGFGVEPVREKEKEPSSTLCVRLAAEAMRYECTQCGNVNLDTDNKMGTDIKIMTDILGTDVKEDLDIDTSMGMGVDVVPALLRRCMEVSRLALLWAKVMKDTRLRLAYNVTKDGDITFKVANFPLRAVWEVRLRTELAVEGVGGGARPQAVLGGVRPLLGAPPPPAAALRAALAPLQRDWGHVPACIWKLFRYLKNKTKDDDLGFWCFKN